jgi:coenzyme PQQ precursor peptide PqqA
MLDAWITLQFLSFVVDELAEVGGGARKHGAPDVGKPRLDLGVGEPGVGDNSAGARRTNQTSGKSSRASGFAGCTTRIRRGCGLRMQSAGKVVSTPARRLGPLCVGLFLLRSRCYPEHKGKSKMTWTTPTLVEICIGLEINGYLPAEF